MNDRQKVYIRFTLSLHHEAEEGLGGLPRGCEMVLWLGWITYRARMTERLDEPLLLCPFSWSFKIV